MIDVSWKNNILLLQPLTDSDLALIIQQRPLATQSILNSICFYLGLL